MLTRLLWLVVVATLGTRCTNPPPTAAKASATTADTVSDTGFDVAAAELAPIDLLAGDTPIARGACPAAPGGRGLRPSNAARGFAPTAIQSAELKAKLVSLLGQELKPEFAVAAGPAKAQPAFGEG